MMFLEKEISKQWDPLFPERLAKEIEELKYDQSGTDGVFKISKDISPLQCYRNLITIGYEWNREVVKGFKKEYTYFKVFSPQ